MYGSSTYVYAVNTPFNTPVNSVNAVIKSNLDYIISKGASENYDIIEV